MWTGIVTAIREAVPDQTNFAIAYEPTWPVGDQDLHPMSLLPATSGFERLPEANAMYAFHWYVPPANADLAHYLEERLADARRLKAAPYASEWNFGASSALSGAKFFSNVAAFESRRIAYTGWQYKNFQGALPRTDVNPTCTGCGSSFFAPDGTMRKWTFEGMSAPFAQSVAGRVLSIDVTPLTTSAAKRQYTLIYVNTTATAPTEIVVNAMWLPQEKLDVQVSDPDAEAKVVQHLPAAKLTEGVSYEASALVVVNHKKTRSQVSITITAKH